MPRTRSLAWSELKIGIMAVAALLQENPSPTDADINAAITNICRCGSYQRIRAAIHAAASQRVSGIKSP